MIQATDLSNAHLLLLLLIKFLFELQRSAECPAPAPKSEKLIISGSRKISKAAVAMTMATAILSQSAVSPLLLRLNNWWLVQHLIQPCLIHLDALLQSLC